MPNHLTTPAFPRLRKYSSVLETCPIVAQHSLSNFRSSVDFSRIVTWSPSTLSSVPYTPAALWIWPPAPGRSSMLWIMEPTGMFFSGRQFPALIGAFSAAMTVSPGRNVNGATIYDNTPSTYCMSATKLVLRGQCSILRTVAGMFFRARL